MTLLGSSFDGFVARDAISTFVANAAVTGAPFARAINPLPTMKGSVAIPRSNPTGFDWVAETGTIPDVAVNDDADVVAVAKLAGIVTFSNEFLDDADLPISDLLGEAVADSMGPALDSGLLFGGGPPAPDGVVAVAPTIAGSADLRADVIEAWGELVDAGAAADQIVAFCSASTLAFEMSRTTDDGAKFHMDGAQAMLGPGIAMIAVPSLSGGETLVADRSRLYLVLRSDFQADMSEHANFGTDEAAMRIKGRFAVACPTPNKTIRTITPAS